MANRRQTVNNLKTLADQINAAQDAEIERARRDGALSALKRADLPDRRRVEIFTEVTGKTIPINHFHQYANQAKKSDPA